MRDDDSRRKERWTLVLGVVALLVWFVGARAAWVVAANWSMGRGTQILWLLGTAMMAGALMDDVPRSEKPIAVALAALVFGAGWAVHALGWSGSAA